jgi:uncharacterized protein (DUF1684 family)
MTAVTAPQAPSALLQRWHRFRTNRNKVLATEHGWLTLTSFQWLPTAPGALELIPGRWSTDGTTAVLTAAESDGFVAVATGDPVAGTVQAVLQDEESLLWVQHGTIVVELVMRAGRYAVRTRDSDSPVRTNFQAVPVFDYRPDLVVQGHFEPYPQPQTAPIRTARPDVPGVATLVGEVVFELGGRTLRLAAEEEKLGALVLSFSDGTSGVSTDDWRKLETTRPRPDGTLVLDFNRTINYPSAFTAFGTCPQPVAGNRLPVSIEAGERKVR